MSTQQPDSSVIMCYYKLFSLTFYKQNEHTLDIETVANKYNTIILISNPKFSDVPNMFLFAKRDVIKYLGTIR